MMTINSRPLSDRDHGYEYYLQKPIQQIKDLDIKNFNFIIFEEDIDNMEADEFKNFYDNWFIPAIEYLNNYLDIDISTIQFKTFRLKQIFVKNIIKFVMNTLPYTYFKNYLNTCSVESFHEALDHLDGIKEKLLEQVYVLNKQYTNFVELMSNIEDTIANEKKRNQFNDMLTLLDTNMDSKFKITEYQKHVIQDTPEQSLKDLMKKYLQNDADNLLE